MKAVKGLKIAHNFLLAGLDIDGFRSNFDKFMVLYNELKLSDLKVSCFCFCETNVTLAESDPFYIDGYNKFILDRIMHDDNKIYKKKGSGIAIFIDNKFKTAHKVESLCICTVDIEIMTVMFTSSQYVN